MYFFKRSILIIGFFSSMVAMQPKQETTLDMLRKEGPLKSLKFDLDKTNKNNGSLYGWLHMESIESGKPQPNALMYK